MASGLQCPGCGHVHPAGLPEIARGDATFRCYGCYRTLSVPEGWTGRPTPRAPRSDPDPETGAPPGAGTRDARSARLAGRRGFWPAGGGTGGPSGAAGSAAARGAAGSAAARSAASSAGAATGGAVSSAGAATEMVPITPGAGPGPGLDRRAGPDDRPDAGAGHGRSGYPAAGARSAPAGWVAPRRTGRPLPVALRALTWAVAFTVGFVVTAVVLRTVGLLGVNTALDLYAGSGLRRFGVLLVMLPLWALLSATMAHLTLEALTARRRRRSTAAAPTTDTPTSV